MKKLQYTTNDPSATTDYLAADNTWKPFAQYGYYGQFQDDVTQTAPSSNVGLAMIFRTTDLSNGVSIVSNGTNLTRITFANTGIYNLQFSSQFSNSDNTEQDVTIWLRLNGSDVAGSAGFVSVPKKRGAISGHTITSWNYLLDVVAGDYYELYWSTTDHTHVKMQFYPAGSPPPSVASVILTVTQQAGIMAGTGITAMNSLTGAAQTLVTGSSGTDFGISSSGTAHTFNLPTASATNRGALSAADWSTFNGKQDAITGAATTITSSNLTASRALVSDGSGKVATNAVTSTELGYLSGVTSSIQTQLNTKIGASSQVLTFQIASTINASATNYLNTGVTTTTIENAATMIAPVAFTLSNMYTVHYTSTQPASGQQVLTVRKNGVDTALSITIASGSLPTTTPYSDLTNSVSFAVGDRMTIKRQNFASGIGGAVSGVSFKMTI
jgi:hypothetical protein